MVIFIDGWRVVGNLGVVGKIYQRALKPAPSIICSGSAYIDFFTVVLSHVTNVESAIFPVEAIAKRVAQSICIYLRIAACNISIWYRITILRGIIRLTVR